MYESNPPASSMACSADVLTRTFETVVFNKVDVKDFLNTLGYRTHKSKTETLLTTNKEEGNGKRQRVRETTKRGKERAAEERHEANGKEKQAQELQA